MPLASTTILPALEDAVMRSTAGAAAVAVGAADVAAGLVADALGAAVVVVVPGLPPQPASAAIRAAAARLMPRCFFMEMLPRLVARRRIAGR
jgi:hypothetical protein